MGNGSSSADAERAEFHYPNTFITVPQLVLLDRNISFRLVFEKKNYRVHW